MPQSLVQKGQAAIERGLGWLRRHDGEIAAMQDLSAHYKTPYLYAVLGEPVQDRRYADLIRARYLREDGDFRTGSADKGWTHLKCSPANRYVYSNGWIIVGMRKLGVYEMSQQGLDFVRRFQSPELGGFYSRFDVASGKVDPRYLDSSSTSSAGLALLACGKTGEARRTGRGLTTEPYTQALLSAIPIPDPTVSRERMILEGTMPSPINPPNGCRFHSRCPFIMEHCSVEEPPFKEYEPGHWAACWLME